MDRSPVGVWGAEGLAACSQHDAGHRDTLRRARVLKDRLCSGAGRV